MKLTRQRYLMQSVIVSVDLCVLSNLMNNTILIAIFSDNKTAARILIENGTNINAKDEHGNALIHLAIKNRNKSGYLHILLSKKKNVSQYFSRQI